MFILDPLKPVGFNLEYRFDQTATGCCKNLRLAQCVALDPGRARIACASGQHGLERGFDGIASAKMFTPSHTWLLVHLVVGSYISAERLYFIRRKLVHFLKLLGQCQHSVDAGSPFIAKLLQ